ncbi:MAG: hypothetical protein RMJ19_07010 [Gemmatales bacterium]|nr:hypothetical protein [Gemmatales bacterium]MDW8175404.1 hypothetical protein [Gemmatales bacterium]
MASIIRCYYTKNKRRQRTKHYYVQFKDHHGIWRRVPAYTDRRASEELGRLLDRLVAERAVGNIASDTLAAAMRLSPKLQSKLI